MESRRRQRPRPISFAGRGPSTLCDSDTRPLLGKSQAGQVSHDPWPFLLTEANDVLDVGEPGNIRRPRKPDHAGSNPAIQTDDPAGPLVRQMGVSSNGKTSGLHPDNEGSTPSTVHWKEMARWWNRQTHGPQKAVPTGREGSSPSLVTDCGVVQRLAHDGSSPSPIA